MPVFTAIATGIATLFGLAGATATTFISVTSWALQGVASLGISLALKSLQGEPEKPQFSVKGQLQIGGEVPRSIILGWRATPGSLVYANYWGKTSKSPNAYETWVISLCDLPGAKLTGMWVNETKVTLPTMTGTPPNVRGWPVDEFKGKRDNFLWIKYYDGTQTTADTLCTDHVASEKRPYGTDRVGYGICYAVVTARVSQKYYSGFPKFKFELEGIPLYDVTKDTSQGGSGTHRIDTPSTWGGDGDFLTAVQVYNLLAGFYYNGKWLYGLQNMTQYRLPALNWIAAINKCRATTKLGGETVATYRSGAEIPVNAKATDIIDSLMTACAGRLSSVGGSFKLYVGEPGTPQWTINDDVFITTQERQFVPFLTLDKTINSVSGTYPEPAEGWNSKPSPPLFNTAYEAEDGNQRLPTSVPFDLVPYSGQVQFLMQSALNEARRARQYVGTLGPEYWGIEPNDITEFTSIPNGFNSKSFRVDGVVDNPDCSVLVNLTEVDSSDYDYDDDTDYIPPTIIDLVTEYPPVNVLYGWSASKTSIEDNNANQRRPAILVSWDGDLDNVQSVRIQVKLTGAEDDDLQYDGTLPYGDPETNPDPDSKVVSFASILPTTTYLVRGILEPRDGSQALWSNQSLDTNGDIIEGNWISVTTDNLAFGTLDILDSAITELKLAAEAVSTAKLQVAAVTTDILAPNSVTNTKIGDAAVTAAKLADEAITATKFASGITPIEIVTSNPTTGNFTGRQVYNSTDNVRYSWDGTNWISSLEDGSVTSAKLADAAVTASKIQDAAISLTKFASGLRPVESLTELPATGNTEGRIVYLTTDGKLYRYTSAGWSTEVPAVDITGQLTDSQLAGIAAAKLTGQITSTQVANDAITTPKIAAGAVETSNLAAGSVIASKIASSAVTTEKLEAGAVTANELAANAVTAGKVQAGAIGTSQLAAGAVTTNILAAGAVTADQIAAGSVTASKIYLTDLSNIIKNPTFEGGSSDLWNGDVNVAAAPGANPPASYALEFPQGDSVIVNLGVVSDAGIPVSPGETYYLSGWSYGDLEVGDADLYYQLYWYTEANAGSGDPAGSVLITPPTANTWSRVQGQITVPNNPTIAKAWVRVIRTTSTGGGTWYATKFVLRRGNDSELIVDGSIVASKIASDAITADKISADAITSGKIQAGAIGTSQLASGAVTAGILAAGSVTTDKIAAGAVIASKMTVTSFDNLIQNGAFDNDLAGWLYSNGYVFRQGGGTVSLSKNIARLDPAPGADVILINSDAGNQWVTDFNSGIRVQPGEQYVFSWRMISGATDGQVQVFSPFIDASGTIVSNPVVKTILPSSPWQDYSVDVTIPANVVKLHFFLRWRNGTTGVIYVTNISVMKKYAGELIVDGAITSNKIAALSITGDKIAAGTITAAKMQAGTITAASGIIADAAITSPKICHLLLGRLI